MQRRDNKKNHCIYYLQEANVKNVWSAMGFLYAAQVVVPFAMNCLLAWHGFTLVMCIIEKSISMKYLIDAIKFKWIKHNVKMNFI